MNNFPVKLGNKEYWISRSIAVCGFVLTGSPDNLSILAVKRGSGCPDEVGKWCCPCGYLDYNETLVGACSREIHEESGLYVNPFDLKMWRIDDNPLSNKQNVTINYWSYKPHFIDIILNNNYCEPNEIDDVQWISLNKIDMFVWAFNHFSLIHKLTDCLFNNESESPVLGYGLMRQLENFPELIENLTLEKMMQIYNSNPILNGD